MSVNKALCATAYAGNAQYVPVRAWLDTPYEDTQVGTRNCPVVVVDTQHYSDVLNAQNSALTIDQTLFEMVSGFLLLSFVTGHVLGRILKTMGKS